MKQHPILKKIARRYQFNCYRKSMKLPIFTRIAMPIVAAVVAACLGSSADGQQISGSTLSIGVQNTITANYVSGAVGYTNWVYGWGCFGVGYYNTVYGSYSIVSGYNNQINGSQSGAFGSSNIVNAGNSFAFGASNTSSASGGIALGNGTKAESFQQIVIGAYNIPLTNPNATAWVSTDPIFVIGNGTSPTATSNAMKVLKDGTVSIYGALLINPKGDLPMGNYTNGPKP